MKTIEVLPYDPEWPKQYENEAQKIFDVLKSHVVKIHHIGSTSVSGLAAKRDLDILLVIDRLEHALVLRNIGYVFKGELNIPLRYFFSKNTQLAKVNLHVCEEDHGFIPLNLSFRNWLRDNPSERAEYQQLKYTLIQSADAGLKTKGPVTNYSRLKDPFIKKALHLSGYDGFTINFCMHDKEWEAAKGFRKCFFRTNDPYTWTFDHKDHKHFICSQGIDIIGYAHIHLLGNHRVAIRIICLQQEQQQKGYGKKFLRLIEKWLILHGYESIYVQSTPETQLFYEKLNYVLMPINDPE